jgi:SAM-dependent methyltransferase
MAATPDRRAGSFGELARDSIARSFDALAPSWDRKHGPVGLRRLGLAVRTAYLGRICEDFGRPRVLDIGCATGQQLLALAHRISEGVGIDISPAMIAKAQLNARDQGLGNRLRFEVLAGESVCPQHFGRFDLILCIGTLEHTADPDTMLARIARLLRPGGVLVLIVARPWHPRSLYTRCAQRLGMIPPFRHLGRRAVQQRAQAVGLCPMNIADLAKRQGPRAAELGTFGLLSSLVHVLSGSYVAAFTAEMRPRAVQAPTLQLPALARLAKPGAVLASVGLIVLVAQTVCASLNSVH